MLVMAEKIELKEASKIVIGQKPGGDLNLKNEYQCQPQNTNESHELVNELIKPTDVSSHLATSAEW